MTSLLSLHSHIHLRELNKPCVDEDNVKQLKARERADKLNFNWAVLYN